MMHEMDHDKIDLEHQEGTLDRGEEPARSKDFAAMNEVNAHEKSLSYWQGIVRYRIALIFCFCVSLGAMLNGLDGSVGFPTPGFCAELTRRRSKGRSSPSRPFAVRLATK